MHRNGIRGCATTLADPSALGSQAELHKSSIADHDLLEALEFVNGEIVSACLSYCLGPPEPTVLGWTLPLNLERRLAVFE